MTVRIAAGGRIYESVPSNQWLEIDYERIILDHREILFQDFFVLPYKKTFKTPLGNKIPDLIMISKDYLSWWVVEVELSHHPLSSHVLKQMEIIISYVFRDDDIEYIYRKLPDIDLEKLRFLIENEPPGYLVLVDQLKQSWKTSLSAFNVKIGVLEIFRSDDGDIVIRINGDQPLPVVLRTIAIGKVMRSSSNIFLKFPRDSLDSLSLSGQYQFLHDGQITLWRRVDYDDSIWLVSIASISNEVHNNIVRILQTPSGRRSISFE